MGLLDRITGPRDLRDLTDAELAELATEIRDVLVRTVLPHRRPPRPQPRRRRADPGDAPGLRLARATGSSSTPATRPTCTRSLTGRAAGFDTLRTEGGLSGYPSRAESDHDVVENSHASTSLSYADGLAKAYAMRGEDRHVAAVIGDGALTGGMAWEALNNIAADGAKRPPAGDRGQRQRPLLHADRRRPRQPPDRRCAPTRATSRSSTWSRTASTGCRGVGPAVYDALHAMKKGMKDALAPQGLFEDLGLKYVGPDRRPRPAGRRAGADARPSSSAAR